MGGRPSCLVDEYLDISVEVPRDDDISLLATLTDSLAGGLPASLHGLEHDPGVGGEQGAGNRAAVGSDGLVVVVTVLASSQGLWGVGCGGRSV